MFWRKKEDYSKQIADLTTKVNNIILSLDVLDQRTKSLRGLVNKKLKYEDEEDNQSEERTQKEPNLKAIMEAFGGSVPIELIEKYKNSN